MKANFKLCPANRTPPTGEQSLNIGYQVKTRKLLASILGFTRMARILTAGLMTGIVLLGMGNAHAAVLGNTPWIVIQCRFSDQPQVPFFDPAFITGSEGMAGYWRDVSYNKISLDGTRVVGWYTLPFTSSQATNMERCDLISACIAAAPDIDVSGFYSVIVILNANIPPLRPGVIGGPGSCGKRVLLDPGFWNNMLAAHEMGHGYDLHDSFDDQGNWYGDPWDIMSADAVESFPGAFGESGPGLNAANLETLGWIQPNQIFTFNGTSRTLTLAALNRPQALGFLMAKASAGSSEYTIEFRRPTDWDAGIPRDTVLIHKVGQNRWTYLMKDQGGPERLPGDTYRDAAGNLVITVLGIDSASSTATISIGKSEFWVDFGYPGLPNSPEDGSSASPFNSLAEGVTASPWGGLIKLKPSSTSETPTINKRVTLEAVGGPVVIGRNL